MKITMSSLLEGVEYTAAPGNEYEVAPGVWGTMKAPTQALVDEVASLSQEEGVTDTAVCRKVLSGLRAFKDEDAIIGMPSQAVRDFFTSVEKTAARLQKLYQQSAPSEEAAGQT
jgi:hypothetical protein